MNHNDRSCTVNGYINGYENALQNSLTRANYYSDTNDIRFLNESKDWLEVANIYLKEIVNEQTVEIQSTNFGSGMF